MHGLIIRLFVSSRNLHDHKIKAGKFIVVTHTTQFSPWFHIDYVFLIVPRLCDYVMGWDDFVCLSVDTKDAEQ